MNNQALPTKSIVTIGLMLFALFFGAGNMIFPPLLGQQAGDNLALAITGFLITGVGLPLLGIIAIAYTGGDLQSHASRAHPIFGILFTITLFLAIGPFFGIPRTATVSYEIGVFPFLGESSQSSFLPLALYSVIFFVIAGLLSLNPSKLVDRIGKFLTPALLIIIGILVVTAFVNRMGDPGSPVTAYESSPFFKGFIEGYLTLDAIAALVFAVVVISAVKERGITDRKQILRATIIAGSVAALALAAVYLSLSYLGATSLDTVGEQATGAAILSLAASYLFGSSGGFILGFAIFAACLTTAIGLISSASTYFASIAPSVSYKTFVLIFSVFSALVSNIGLSQLISFSLPLLVMIYPLAIVLMILAFANNWFKGYRAVYIGSLIPTFAIGVVDGLNAAFPAMMEPVVSSLLFLPLMAEGVGWIIPAFAGAVIGYVIALSQQHNTQMSTASYTD